MEYTKTVGTYPSVDQKNEIHYTVWAPKTPRMILQIVHDLGESADFYESFAAYLTGRNILVCLSELPCHGSAAEEGAPCHFGDKDGDITLIDDVNELFLRMRKHYRRLPYVLLGQGFGSVIARCFLTRYRDAQLNGAVLVGTCGSDPAFSKYLRLARLICTFRGAAHVSPSLCRRVLGRYPKSVGETETDWLCGAPAAQKMYEKTTGIMQNMTAGALRDMLRMAVRISDEKWPADVPQRFFLLFISGSLDPVGDNGRGVRALCARLDDAGIYDLSLKLYSQSRHAVLFDTERTRVWQELSVWLEALRDAAVACETYSGLNMPSFMHPALRWDHPAPAASDHNTAANAEEAPAPQEMTDEEKRKAAFPLQGKMWL